MAMLFYTDVELSGEAGLQGGTGMYGTNISSEFITNSLHIVRDLLERLCGHKHDSFIILYAVWMVCDTKATDWEG